MNTILCIAAHAHTREPKRKRNKREYGKKRTEKKKLTENAATRKETNKECSNTRTYPTG